MKEANLNCVLDYGKSWAARDGMTVIHYRNILKESVFTIAPWGNNPESLRLYESMEAGSIPIFQRVRSRARNPLTAFGDEFPVPQFETWKKAASYVANMKEKAVELDQLQAKLVTFWGQFKAKTQTSIAEIIDKSFQKAHGCTDC